MHTDMRTGANGVALFLGGVLLIGFAAFLVSGGHKPLLPAITLSLFLAVVTPITIIAIRHQVRLTRIKLINLFGKTFQLSTTPPQAKGADTEATDKGRSDVVAFEFLKGKYYVDLDIEEKDYDNLSLVPRFPMMTHADWMLLLCSVPFMLFAGIGMFLLFAPFIEILHFSEGVFKDFLWTSTFTIGGAPSEIVDGERPLFEYYHANTIVVAAMAFAGAYFYSIRLLLRAVAVFDLSPVTFLRCFTHMVLAVLLAVMIYRVFPSIEGFLGFLAEAGLTQNPVSDKIAPDPRDGVKSIWLLLAFTLGFIPDAAIQYALKKSGVTFKERYSIIDNHTKVIPVTIIDGIDHFIAFRLEESNIFDVQNLATFNPIMLHIESPYGIYQTVDWVAQAQLCTVVGAERFLALKAINVRTIFDLERAVLSEDADDTLVSAIGAILTMDCDRDAKARSAFGMKETIWSAVPQADPTKPFNYRAALSLGAVKHIAALIVDDLHVRRLRQIWKIIRGKLGRDSESLEDSHYPQRAREGAGEERKAA